MQACCGRDLTECGLIGEKMEYFYLITNEVKDPGLEFTRRVGAYIEKRGKKWQAAKKDERGHTISGTIPKEADCALVIGGDGTLIRAVRDLGGIHIPMLGINLGTLGYLTEVDKSDAFAAVDALIAGTPVIEERMMIEGIRADGTTDFAINEVVLSREGTIRIVPFNVYVNGTLLNTYQADGVLVCTPTGSTGYNLSAGGPVVEPTASLLVVTPICSHALNTSSVVLSADDVVDLEVCTGRYGQPETAMLCFDGADEMLLHTGDRVRIRKAAQTVRLIKLSQESFMKTMHRKMREA